MEYIFACLFIVYFFFYPVVFILSFIFAPWTFAAVFRIFKPKKSPKPKVEAEEPPAPTTYDAKYKIRNPFDNDPK